MHDVPIKMVRSKKFAKIQSGRLLQELGLGRVGCLIAEGDQAGARKIDGLAVDLEDMSCCLQLSF